MSFNVSSVELEPTVSVVIGASDPKPTFRSDLDFRPKSGDMGEFGLVEG
jgi:hypothetical protein